VRDTLYGWINVYIHRQKEALDSIPVDTLATIIERIAVAWKEDRQIFVFGNGGSAANASHFSTDMFRIANQARVGSAWRVLTSPIRVASLTDNVSWITATANDFDYDEIFVRQLMTFARQRDIVIGLSVSGNSPNIVKAFHWAAKNNIEAIAIVGRVGEKKPNVLPFATHHIAIDESHYGRVEDVQMAICHMIAYAFSENAGLASSAS
jgi:D-sedoheptulose 7-phosphate isomerase